MAEKPIEVGKLLTGDEKRDAIHIGILMVEAAQKLSRGDWVKTWGGKAWLSEPKEATGIVDPYLEDNLEPGHKFWMFVKPGTIVGLRHEWEHPLIPTEKEVGASRAWLEGHAADLEISYDRLMEGTLCYLEHGHELDLPFTDDKWEDVFWEHYQKVTGVLVPEAKKQDFFTCCY